MERGGQLALAGVLLLAAVLITLAAIRTPQPLAAYERGHLQAAQLLHLARVCLSGECDATRLQGLLLMVAGLNRSEPLRMYPVTSADVLNRTSRGERGWLVEYRVAFRISTPAGEEEVALYARVESVAEGVLYSRQLGGRAYALARVRVSYSNVLTTPFFNATVCPRLSDPRGAADVVQLGSCEWLVGVPLELSQGAGGPYVYKLRDEYGVVVPVYAG